MTSNTSKLSGNTQDCGHRAYREFTATVLQVKYVSIKDTSGDIILDFQFFPLWHFLKSNSTGYYLLKSGIPAALLTPAIPRCPHSGPAVSLLCQAAVDRPADGTGSLGGPRPGLHTEGRLAGPGGFVGPPLCSCCELKPLNEQEKMSLWGHKAVNIYLLLQCS